MRVLLPRAASLEALGRLRPAEERVPAVTTPCCARWRADSRRGMAARAGEDKGSGALRWSLAFVSCVVFSSE